MTRIYKSPDPPTEQPYYRGSQGGKGGPRPCGLSWVMMKNAPGIPHTIREPKPPAEVYVKGIAARE